MDRIKVSSWIRKRYSSLRQEYDTFTSVWLDIQKYLCPRMGRGLDGNAKTDTNNGRRKDGKIITSTATKALSVLANGMFTGMTPRSRPWFHLDAGITSENSPAVRWLYDVELAIQRAMQKSNAYGVLKKAYAELGAFGTYAFMVLPDAKKGAICLPFTAGEYMLGTDRFGKVDTFYRESWWTVRQVADEFGFDMLPKALKDKMTNGQSEDRVCVGNLIEPNDSAVEFPEIEGFAWRSLYFVGGSGMGAAGSGDDVILAVRGYEIFPVVAPRWSTIGTDSYGTDCPGMLALPDTMMIQKIRGKSLKMLDKHVDPPLLVNSSAGLSEVNSLPGGLNFVTSIGSTPAVQSLYQTQPQIGMNEQMVQNVQRDIQTAFFNDLFLAIMSLPDSKRASATEIVQRNEERLSQIGPVLETLDQELYEPLIQLYAHYMFRAGMMPEPPSQDILLQLAEGGIGVSYVSMLAQAQKAVGKLVPMEQTLQFASAMAAFDPAVMDKIDPDQMVDEYARSVGCPPSTTRTDDEVRTIRETRAQIQMQQQQQQQAQAFLTQAQGAKTLAEARQIGGGL